MEIFQKESILHFDYVIMFFENLLQGKNNNLQNSDLYIKELFENNN